MICSNEKIGEACRKTAGLAERLPRRDYERWRISWLKTVEQRLARLAGKETEFRFQPAITNPECGEPARQS